MLEIKTMPLRDFSVYCFFYPSDLVNLFVSPIFHQFASEAVLGIDSPNEDKSISLESIYWDFLDFIVV
jgi:hypothetical protein